MPAFADLRQCPRVRQAVKDLELEPEAGPLFDPHRRSVMIRLALEPSGLRQRPRGLPLPTLVVAAVALALVATAFAGARSTAAAGLLRISFYGDIGNPLGSGNPLLTHPSRVLLAEDGSVAVASLRWTGWGTSTAHATGYVATSNCTPSCARGAWLWTPARLTLSSPGKILGHEVYRCFRVTTSATQSAPYGCIGRVGSLYVYRTHWTIGATVNPLASGWFSWPTVHNVGDSMIGVVVCALDSTTVTCSSTPSTAPYGEIVLLDSAGAATTCVIPTCGGAIADQPAGMLPFGSLMTQGPFRCSSAASGITCVVAKTGLGFRFNAAGVSPVG